MISVSSIANLAANDSTLKGFNGCFCVGNYAYFIPSAISNVGHGKIARLDLNDFSTVSSIDLASINSSYKWYLDGVTDGQYGYACPYGASPTHGYVARFSLSDFTTNGVTILNLASINASYVSFNGCSIDSNYLYLSPFSSAYIVRIALNNFTTSGVTVIPVTNVPLPPPNQYVLFKGMCLDSRYGYIVSSNRTDGKVVRFDTQNFDIDHLSYIDLGTIDSDLGGFGRPFVVGNYVYVPPLTKIDGTSLSGKLVRIAINNFSQSGVSILNLGAIDSELVGFYGGFYDSHYAYVIPDSYGKIVKIDPNDFSSSGVEVLDFRTTDSEIVSCKGGFFDSNYAYVSAFRTARAGQPGTNLGKVVKIDLGYHPSDPSYGDGPTCWSFVAKYLNSNRRYQLTGPHNAPSTFQLPKNVDASTAVLIEHGKKKNFKIVQ